MKKIQPRKLVIQREALRHLGADRLQHVAGGSPTSLPTSPCGTTHLTKDPIDEHEH